MLLLIVVVVAMVADIPDCAESEASLGNELSEETVTVSPLSLSVHVTVKVTAVLMGEV